jgi:hypothetical protein
VIAAHWFAAPPSVTSTATHGSPFGDAAMKRRHSLIMPRKPRCRSVEITLAQFLPEICRAANQRALIARCPRHAVTVRAGAGGANRNLGRKSSAKRWNDSRTRRGGSTDRPFQRRTVGCREDASQPPRLLRFRRPPHPARSRALPHCPMPTRLRTQTARTRARPGSRAATPRLVARVPALARVLPDLRRHHPQTPHPHVEIRSRPRRERFVARAG